MTKRVFLVTIVLLFLIVGPLPVLSMLVKSVMVDGHLSLAAYRGLLTSSRQWLLMGHSWALASLVTLLALGGGVPLGILLGKTNLPFRRGFTALFAIPLLIPPYILAVSWADLLGQEGIAAHLFSAKVIREISSFLFGLPGCVMILFSIFLPIPVLLTMVSLRAINPRLEEAGRLFAGWGGVMKSVILPLILPGILFAGMLVFLLSFGEFSVPNFLRYDVFPVESFVQFSAFYNFKAATAAAVPLALVTLILLFGESVFLRGEATQIQPAPRGDFIRVDLGKFRPWVAGVVAVGALALVIVPLLALMVQARGMDAYVEALRRGGDSLFRSLLYAVLGASLLTVMGFFTGYLIQSKALKGWRAVDFLTIFLFALPGTVIGIGLISLWNTPLTNLIYATPLIILFGYVAKYTALTSRVSAAQLARIPASMEEAARIAGAGWFQRVFRVVMPLARRGLLAGWLVGYIFTLRDTGITILVYPPGRETLPVRIYTLMANGSPSLVAALCVVMIAATLLPAGIFWACPLIRTRKVA